MIEQKIYQVKEVKAGTIQEALLLCPWAKHVRPFETKQFYFPTGEFIYTAGYICFESIIECSKYDDKKSNNPLYLVQS